MTNMTVLLDSTVDAAEGGVVRSDRELAVHVRGTLARLSKSGGLPMLSGTVTRALAAAREPDADLATICGIVETDVGVTARVLRLANSALYRRGRSHDTLNGAVGAIGIGSLTELLLAASLRSMLRSGDVLAGTLWDHALATALAGRMLAPVLGCRHEHAFLAGLFHDVGRFAFYKADPFAFEAITGLLALEPEHDRAFEREWFGFDHTEAGAVLVADWGFSTETVEAIRWHHEPDQAGFARPLAELVRLADALTRTVALGGVGEPAADAAILDARLSRDEQTVFAERIDHELQEHRQSFA